jgi:hypothetical protein
MIVLPSQDAKFVPFNPAHPEGPQLAVLSGDIRNGPVAVMLKLKKGAGFSMIVSNPPPELGAATMVPRLTMPR